LSIGIKAVSQKFNLKSLGFRAPRSLNSPIESDMGVKLHRRNKEALTLLSSFSLCERKFNNAMFDTALIVEK
jgi:hypothetical protein